MIGIPVPPGRSPLHDTPESEPGDPRFGPAWAEARVRDQPHSAQIGTARSRSPRG